MFRAGAVSHTRLVYASNQSKLFFPWQFSVDTLMGFIATHRSLSEENRVVPHTKRRFHVLDYENKLRKAERGIFKSLDERVLAEFRLQRDGFVHGNGEDVQHPPQQPLFHPSADAPTDKRQRTRHNGYIVPRSSPGPSHVPAPRVREVASSPPPLPALTYHTYNELSIAPHNTPLMDRKRLRKISTGADSKSKPRSLTSPIASSADASPTASRYSSEIKRQDSSAADSHSHASNRRPAIRRSQLDNNEHLPSSQFNASQNTVISISTDDTFPSPSTFAAKYAVKKQRTHNPSSPPFTQRYTTPTMNRPTPGPSKPPITQRYTTPARKQPTPGPSNWQPVRYTKQTSRLIVISSDVEDSDEESTRADKGKGKRKMRRDVEIIDLTHLD